MALIFADGWDNYSTMTDFWDIQGNDTSVNTTPGIPRTGLGCLQIHSAAFGPVKYFSHLQHVLFVTNWNCTAAGNVMDFMTGPDAALRINVNADGSLSFTAGPIHPGPTYTTAGVGLYTFGQYNNIAVEVQNFGWPLPNSTIKCWVNGVLVFNQSGLWANIYPFPGPGSGAAAQFCDGVRLMSPGGNAFLCYHDDFYALDCSLAPNQAFLGALKLYALPPTANAAVAWTPLAGTNWSEVNEVPPDGDASYNSSATVGQIDQYVYPLVGPPPGSSFAFLQHELDMEVDSGSRSVASVVNGTAPGPATALPNGYHIYPTAYDLNPSTGLPWVAGDFPLNAGPKVTA